MNFLSWLGQQIPEAFGLTKFHHLIDQFADHEEKIKKVRNLLPTLISDTALLKDGFISYRSQKPSVETHKAGAKELSDGSEHLHSTHADSCSDVSYVHGEEFATILPSPSQPRQHQRRVPSLHVKGSTNGSMSAKSYASTSSVTWEVSYMLSPNSAQVRRCSTLREATGEACGIYILDAYKEHDIPKFDQTSRESISRRMGHWKMGHRKMMNPFNKPPPEILQTSSPNWVSAIQAEQASRFPKDFERWQSNNYPLAMISGLGSDGSITINKSLLPMLSQQIHSSRNGLRKATLESSDIGTQGEHREVSSRKASASNVPFCLRLRDVADKGAFLLKDLGCPHKYYVSGSAEEAATCEYVMLAGDGYWFSVWLPAHVVDPLQVPLDEFLTAVEQDINQESIIEHLENFLDLYHPEHLASLNAFLQASKIFENFPEATIALSVMKQPLGEAKWCKHDPQASALGKALSCLAFFETGSVNVDPVELKDVMAMSAGNSLFMAGFLFNDPSNDSEDLQLGRIIGNIGKPGISFLLSAQVLDSLTPDYSAWKSVPYAPYDGRSEDSFAQTTLHLTLTGDEQPLNIGQSGYRDKEVFLVETVIRAYDKTRWVADLDLKLPFTSPLIRLGKCSHSEQERDDFLPLDPLISIDSWDELLDLPPHNCIVRAKSNWLARQAVTVFVMQQNRPLVVASDAVCWACVAGNVTDYSPLLVVS